MTEFEDTIDRWIVDLPKLNQEVYTGVVDLAHESIQTGSAITGAPGQPVGQYGPGYNPGHVGGALRASWQKWYPSPTEAMIATDSPYAEGIEDLVGPHGAIHIRSTVGGGHSLKLTIAGMQRITDHVVARVAASR